MEYLSTNLSDELEINGKIKTQKLLVLGINSTKSSNCETEKGSETQSYQYAQYNFMEQKRFMGNKLIYKTTVNSILTYGAEI